MQTTREAVRAALAFVKLAARVQLGEDQLDHRCFFGRVHAKGDATAIVFPASGKPNQTHDAFTTVSVYNRLITNLLTRAKQTGDLKLQRWTGTPAAPFVLATAADLN